MQTNILTTIQCSRCLTVVCLNKSVEHLQVSSASFKLIVKKICKLIHCVPLSRITKLLKIQKTGSFEISLLRIKTDRKNNNLNPHDHLNQVLRHLNTRGGGGTSILKVSGTCRWQGYDFANIAIKTGCLNQPNHWHRVSNAAYLATGMDYSVYHRLAFPPTMFMTGPRSRHRRDATRRCVRDQYSNDP